MTKFFTFILLFIPGCRKQEEPYIEPLHIEELNMNPYQILTVEDTEELAKFGIRYDMEINNREK